MIIAGCVGLIPGVGGDVDVGGPQSLFRPPHAQSRTRQAWYLQLLIIINTLILILIF